VCEMFELKEFKTDMCVIIIFMLWVVPYHTLPLG